MKLGIGRIPVVVQAKPDRLQNIMMMFAIHNARQDWDPLPTALKLQELEDEFTKRQGRTPMEVELAELASLTRGEVRRLKNLLRLPPSYIDELMAELEKPRSKQVITARSRARGDTGRRRASETGHRQRQTRRPTPEDNSFRSFGQG